MILPSILSADFARLAGEIAEVEQAGADFLHLDVMDGHFVPNISFGPPVVASVRKAFPSVYLDTHLMITQPLRYAEAFVQAGASNLTFHVEAVADPAETARQIARLGCHVGITLNPATPVEAIYPALDHVNMVLVMSVVPGFSGQQFMPEVLSKCRALRPRLRADQRLEIDGGIKTENIALARSAGVDWFVAASAVFGANDRAKAIAELRGNIQA